MWKNLLPQGTRTVEIASGYALILTGLLTPLGLVDHVSSLDQPTVTGILLVVFGLLQVLCILHLPKLELLRTILAWASGCFWIWVGISTTDFHWTAEDIACLFLGLSNLYGFIINFNLLHIAWTE